MSKICYSYESAGNVICIKLIGRWSEPLPKEFIDICKTYNKVLFKCDELLYISAVGLRQLMSISRSKNVTQVDFIGTNDTVKGIINITGFDKEINVY